MALVLGGRFHEPCFLFLYRVDFIQLLQVLMVAVLKKIAIYEVIHKLIKAVGTIFLSKLA